MTNPKHTDTSRSGDLVERLMTLLSHEELRNIVEQEIITPVLSFDSEHRARQAILDRQKKVGTKMVLVRIIQQEEILS